MTVIFCTKWIKNIAGNYLKYGKNCRPVGEKYSSFVIIVTSLIKIILYIAEEFLKNTEHFEFSLVFIKILKILIMLFNSENWQKLPNQLIIELINNNQ